MLCYVVLYCVALFCSVSLRVALRVLLSCVMLCCGMLCCVALRVVVLYCVE